MRLELPRDHQRLAPPFRLHHPRVLARRTAVIRRRPIRVVLAAEDAASERTIRHHAQTIIGARRQMLDLELAVHGVLIGLTRDGTIDAEAVGDVADLGAPPSLLVWTAEIAHLPRPG